MYVSFSCQLNSINCTHCSQRDFFFQQDKPEAASATHNVTFLQLSKQSFITARSELRKVLSLAPSICGFGLCIKYLGTTAEWICSKFTRKTCLVSARTSSKVRVKHQRSRSPETKNGIFGPFGGLRAVYVWKNIFSLQFLFVYEIFWELLEGFAPNSHARRIWSLASRV